MFLVSELKKWEYWNYLTDAKHRKGLYTPQGTPMGVRYLAAARQRVWRNDMFWNDIIVRHGGLDCTPEYMELNDPATFDHCIGNFYGMLLGGQK